MNCSVDGHGTAHAGTPALVTHKKAEGFTAFKTGPAKPKTGDRKHRYTPYVESPKWVDYTDIGIYSTVRLALRLRSS
jgi:hypothetical protein